MIHFHIWSLFFSLICYHYWFVFHVNANGWGDYLFNTHKSKGKRGVIEMDRFASEEEGSGWCIFKEKFFWLLPNSSQLFHERNEYKSYSLISCNFFHLAVVNLDLLLSHTFLCSCSLLCSNYCFFQTFCTKGS